MSVEARVFRCLVTTATIAASAACLLTSSSSGQQGLAKVTSSQKYFTGPSESFKKSKAPTVTTKSDVPLDIYGGVLSGHVQAEATGLIHLKKVNGRWVFYTALGNPFWELSFDNARPANDLGVDVNGNGGPYWIAQKYAIGRGPRDGFTDARSRWGYYVRQMARSWGFMGAGSFTYPPVITNTTTWLDPPMGRMPSNKMTFAITHNNSPEAMKAGAKNLYASVFNAVGAGPFFVDPYDPKFQSSVRAVARTLSGHGKDPWVRYVGTSEVDQLRGMLGTHPHLGFVVAATNPSVDADSSAWGGSKAYTDNKNYAKYALRDYLRTVYPTIAALNAAWGTHYTTFDSDGGWGKGSGFLDENGVGLCATWSRGGPAYPCSNVHMQADLDGFATQMVRRYYSILHTEYRAVTGYLLVSTDIAPQTWNYALDGMRDSDGKPLVDLISIASFGIPSDAALEDAIYKKTGLPMIMHEQEMANNDSPLAMAGKVDKLIDLGNTKECGVGDQGVQVTCDSCNFWWWNGATNGSVYIPPFSNNSMLKFSDIPYYKTDGTTKYAFYFRRFVDAHNFTVCPMNFGRNGNRTDFLRMVKVGSTFKRTESVTWEQTPDTQEARGLRYEAMVKDLWTRKASGDNYFVGLEFWDWWDNNWVHSNYREVENFGLVTPRGNAYDGVQAVSGPAIDQYGFPAGGEAATYGNFLSKVTETNRSITLNIGSIH